MNLRDKILNAKDIKEEAIYVEDWDVKILVKGMTGAERNKIIENNILANGKIDLVKTYPELLIASCYDPETGEKIFKETDRDLLNQKSGAAIEEIAKVAVRLNGLGQEQLELVQKN